MALWNFGHPLVNELVRGLSTALAVHAGRVSCPACAPSVTCPSCPSLTCSPGSVAAPVSAEVSGTPQGSRSPRFAQHDGLWDLPPIGVQAAEVCG